MAIEKDDQIKMPKEILPEEVELQEQDMNPEIFLQGVQGR